MTAPTNILDIRRLLQVMNDHEASDLYVTVGSPPAYRINGIVRPAGSTVLSPEATEALSLSIMNEKQQQEFLRSNELTLSLYYKNFGRYRASVFIQKGFIGLVIRRIKDKIPAFEELGLPPILQDLSMAKRGLVLVVGATGSGKSTSLASMIDYRNTNQAGHIICVEDPIEFVHEHKKSLVTQREVGIDTTDFHIALRSALRQAPDVIMIGEVRDEETMRAAITYAETGHLCFATLHSNNTYQAMERIMNFFPPAQHKQIYLQLSLNIRGIVSQRLIRTVDSKRIPAVEIMLGSPRVKDLIYKGEIGSLKEAIEKSTNLGMQSFDQHLYELYQAGRISLEEALKNADSANNLRLRIKLTTDDSYDDVPNSPFTGTPAPTVAPVEEDTTEDSVLKPITKQEPLKIQFD
ncbi:PilT/PilU family type 4a pilus ATPase [bacterium]|nr:PilT/PilU family type 4a pilus ATPase [bacterium]